MYDGGAIVSGGGGGGVVVGFLLLLVLFFPAAAAADADASAFAYARDLLSLPWRICFFPPMCLSCFCWKGWEGPHRERRCSQLRPAVTLSDD